MFITIKELGDSEKIIQSYENFAKHVLLGHALVSSKSGYQNPLV